MRLDRSLRLTVAALLALGLSQTAFASEERGGFTRTLSVTGKADVEVHTGSGSITVRSGDAKSVHVRARIQANDSWAWFGGSSLSAQERVRRIESNPPIKQIGDRIVIGRIEDAEVRRNVSIDYEISVPEETRLQTETGSGDTAITGVAGPVRANSGSGSITASRIGSEMRGTTGSGDIKVETVKGRVYLSSGSGTLQAMAVAGGFSGETGSGDISFEQTSPGEVTARSGSGSIRLRNVSGGVSASTGSGDVDVDGEARSGWKIASGSGSIDVRLATKNNFDLDARSNHGDVVVDFPVTVQGAMKPNRVQGKVGAGGVLISLETGSGSIHVK